MADANWDLVTADVASTLIAVRGTPLNAAETAALSQVITSASREIARFCNRFFVQNSFDEIIIPTGGRADRGEAASCKLKGFPVQSIVRVAVGRTTALTISNTDPVNNQDASVGFQTTGDAEIQLTNTGLQLYSIANGVEAIYSPTWTMASPFTTIQAMATTVNGYGGGWQAVVTGGSPGGTNFAGYPAAWLCGARESKGAFAPGTYLDIFATRMTDYTVDRPAGIVYLGYDSLIGAMGFGASDNFGWADWGDPSLPAFWGQVRVTYTAGFNPIPADIQTVCAEVIKATLDRLKFDGTLQSETAKDYSYTARLVILGLPDWAMQILDFYKDGKF